MWTMKDGIGSGDDNDSGDDEIDEGGGGSNDDMECHDDRTDDDCKFDSYKTVYQS